MPRSTVITETLKFNFLKKAIITPDMRRKWLSALTLLSLLVQGAWAQPAVVAVVPSAVLPALEASPLLPLTEFDYTLDLEAGAAGAISPLSWRLSRSRRPRN